MRALVSNEGALEGKGNLSFTLHKPSGNVTEEALPHIEVKGGVTEVFEMSFPPLMESGEHKLEVTVINESTDYTLLDNTKNASFVVREIAEIRAEEFPQSTVFLVTLFLPFFLYLVYRRKWKGRPYGLNLSIL